MTDADLLERCRAVLADRWAKLCNSLESGYTPDFTLDQQLRDCIYRCVNSRTKTYRYVLPTQLVAKIADPSLDCRALQKSRGTLGSFDARTIAHSVIVPFDQQNENVLGGSPEPYVNNPLRIPEISVEHRSQQKDKATWDDLCHILREVQSRNDPDFTEQVFLQVLKSIYERLQTVRVSYPVPKRISLEKVLDLIERFTRERSGGERLEVVTAALFVTIGRRFHLFEEVRRTRTTAPDAPTQAGADIECVDKSGEVVLVVEAKDRDLTITQLRDKVAQLRGKRVSEVFFVTARGVAADHEKVIDDLIRKAFAGGQNIYVMQLIEFSRPVLALVGESSRRTFIDAMRSELDKYSDIQHRREWARLLGEA